MKWKKPDSSALFGAVALGFLIIGYQTALFVHKAAVMRIVSNMDAPDTVYRFIPDSSVLPAGANPAASHAGAWGASGRSAVHSPGGSGARTPDDSARGSSGFFSGRSSGHAISLSSGHSASPPARHFSGRSFNAVAESRQNAPHTPAAEAVRARFASARGAESFPFDPNTASISDLVRLGFTLRQAESIDNYRKKGGIYRRKSDFARSFVVSDSIYARLEPYIEIPLLDINAADSAAFEALPGIGPYFAAKMVAYRRQLNGYSYKEQLMEIYRFDKERFDALSDLIRVGPSEPYRLWTLPADSLGMHPYITPYSARGIVLFRENNPESLWTVEALAEAGVIGPEYSSRLSRCRIALP